jgi:hypothetical protein
VTRIVKGSPQGSWEKRPGRRNEALARRVNARAAAAIYGLDRFEERHWRRIEDGGGGGADSGAMTSRHLLGFLPCVRRARQVIHSGYVARGSAAVITFQIGAFLLSLGGMLIELR